MRKNDITLNISKSITKIFDHRLDVIEEHNLGTFETILGFWFLLLTQQTYFF